MTNIVSKEHAVVLLPDCYMITVDIYAKIIRPLPEGSLFKSSRGSWGVHGELTLFVQEIGAWP